MKTLTTNCQGYKDSKKTGIKIARLFFYFLFVLTLLMDQVLASSEVNDLPIINFNIPRQAADDALTIFGQQANITVLYRYDLVKEYETNSLQGRFLLEEAIYRLLDDTGLEAKFDSVGHLIISQEKDQESRKMKGRKSWLGTAIAFLVSSSMFSQQSLGEDKFENNKETDGGKLEEVVVTASKRGAQVLQDVAGNIQVISSGTLEQLSVEGMEDYIKMVPGLDTISSGTGQTQIVVRGITPGREDEHPRGATALAMIYVDDIPISMPGYTPDLGVYDVERIEVLRGPQGTLYGKSAMTGTIRVITKQPNVNEFASKIKANFAAVEDGDPNYGFSGSTNIPLSAKTALRITGFSNTKGGFIDNRDPLIGEDDYNSQEKMGGRAQLAYYGDVMTIRGTVFYDSLEADGRPDEFKVDPNDPRLFGITDERQITRFIEDKFESEFVGGSLSIDWNIKDRVNITSTTSYYESDITTILDDTYRMNAPGFLKRFTGVETIVDSSSYLIDWTTTSIFHETRIASTYESPLQWVAGFYFENEERDYYENDVALGLNAVMGLAPDEPLLGNPPNYIYQSTRVIESEQVALFGEAAYRITENLELLVGLRWFRNERDHRSQLTGLIQNSRNAFFHGDTEEDDVIPKVQLTYNLTDDALIYASYAEGYRQGGSNLALLSGCEADVAALGKTLTSGYESDSLFNYEFGTKTAWMDNHLIVNATLFHIIWDDIQNPVSLPCSSTPTYNVGQIENTGMEAEVVFRASDMLTFRLGMTWMIDSEVTESAPGTNQKGDTPPYVRDLMASASAEYRFPLWSGDGFIRADIRYVDDALTEFSSRDNVRELPAYDIIDLTLGYQHGSWNFTVDARNISDERIVTNIDPDRRQPVTYSLGAPRSLGVSVTRHF